jgi:DNA adenine methylase
MTSLSAKPFLKWAGGKRWLVPHLADLLNSVASYAEPFLGSGTIFFAAQPKKAKLSDNNSDLINAFRMVRDNPYAVLSCLRHIPIDRESFMAIRNLTQLDPVCRAARFVYLNRTAFNGLYRVNKLGHFNVPFGCKPGTKLFDEDQMIACSLVLQSASIETSDFRVALKAAEDCELLFLDPPYTIRHSNNCFRRYNEQLFAWRDQIDLARMANRLSASGNKVIITNAWNKDVASLYSKIHYQAVRLSRPSNMASSAAFRGRYEELLLISRNIAFNPEETSTLPSGRDATTVQDGSQLGI